MVVREFGPGRTTAPEAVEVLGQNLNPATIEMKTSSLSNMIRLDVDGVNAARRLAQPQAHRLQAQVRARIDRRTKPYCKAMLKLEIESMLEDLPRARRPAADLLVSAHGGLRPGSAASADWSRPPTARIGERSRLIPNTMEPPVSEPQTPDWVRDAIFYQIFPDRFARSLTVPKPRHLDEWGAPPTYHGYQGAT